MSERTAPKFSVGQPVAVMTSLLEVVIPMTTVTTVEWIEDEVVRNPVTGELRRVKSVWAYTVADAPRFGASLRETRFRESCLRPIDPDPGKEYMTDKSNELEPHQ